MLYHPLSGNYFTGYNFQKKLNKISWRAFNDDSEHICLPPGDAGVHLRVFYFRHCVRMYSCKYFSFSWSLMIPARILRTLCPAPGESSTVAVLPTRLVLAVSVWVGTEHRPSMRTRPPAAKRRCKASFSAFASASSFVYLTSSAATSR